MPQAILPFIVANAGTIATVASAATAYIGGQQQAAATSKAAFDNYNIQQGQLQQEAQMQSNAAMQEKGERAKQLMLEQARIKTISGESGISGNSVDALLQDSYMQAGIDMSTMEGNRLNRGLRNTGQLRSAYATAESTSNKAYSEAPSLLGTALNIGGEVLKSDYVKTNYGKKEKPVKT